MRVVSPAIVPRDITDEFKAATSRLGTGQLVKDEFFTLFEAVGALEIMDSKMDSGYIAPGENYAQALEDDYDVTRELSPEEVLGIMDQLLCHEMAWHMGHPLSQTLFTSIYLNKLLWPVPKTVEEARFDSETSSAAADAADATPLVHLVLRTYCLALIKACDFVLGRVTSEYFYEEEDFVTQVYNRSLLTQFDADHFYNLINKTISWLDGQEGKLDDKLREAIKCRLVFRREFLAALEQDIQVMETRRTESFANCLSQLALLERTTSLGKPVPDAFSLKIQRRLASTVPPRPMVNISIERAVAHAKRMCQDAIDLEQILDYRGPHNFRVAIWTLLSRKPQPSVYIRSLAQTVIVNGMTVLGSVSVKQFLYDDLTELVLPFSVLLQANMDDVEVPSDPRFQIARHMDEFVGRFAQPFVDTFRTACLNRCRVRRAICHTAVDWDNLQIEAEELDMHLRSLNPEPALTSQGGQPTYSYPLSSWTYHQKLNQLRLIMQLGFELSIYSPEELPGIYWYMTHICSTHLGHVERMRTFTVAASKRNLVSMTIAGKKKSVTDERQAAFKKTLGLLERLTTYLVAVDALAIGLHALYVLLDRHNILPSASSSSPSSSSTTRTPVYSSDALRYELRMKPYIPITLPELVPYEDYRRESDLEGDSDAVVLERATKAISEARKAWEAVLANGAFHGSRDSTITTSDISDREERKKKTTTTTAAVEEDWKKDVKDTMRACIGASIAIETMRKAMAMGDSEKKKKKKKSDVAGTELKHHVEVKIPEVGSKARWHDWWVVPQIVELKVATGEKE